MNLNDLFGDDTNSDGDVAEEKQRTPWVKYDWKTQFLKLRFLEDFNELQSEADVFHWVQNIGPVSCNRVPLKDKKTGGLFLWDGWSKGENKKPEYNCAFCAETKKLKDEAIAKAGGPLSPEGKAAAIQANKLHNRSQLFKVNVEYEIWERISGKKKPEKQTELAVAIHKVKINDLFNENGKGEYWTLKNFFDNKGTIMGHWFMQDSSGKLTPDDPLKDSEKVQVDIFEKPKTMDYATGLARYQGRREEAAKAEPLEEALSAEDDEDIF